LGFCGCAFAVNLFEIDSCGDSGAAFAAFDDGDVEMGTGDWVSPP
jgi:hypothetical protein